MISFNKQSSNEENIRTVVEVLPLDWLPTGPKVVEFEPFFS
jgi:dTDP-4-amino-4,6-dideoxygalactose transaminase